MLTFYEERLKECCCKPVDVDYSIRCLTESINAGIQNLNNQIDDSLKYMSAQIEQYIPSSLEGFIVDTKSLPKKWRD